MIMKTEKSKTKQISKPEQSIENVLMEVLVDFLQQPFKRENYFEDHNYDEYDDYLYDVGIGEMLYSGINSRIKVVNLSEDSCTLRCTIDLDDQAWYYIEKVVRPNIRKGQISKKEIKSIVLNQMSRNSGTS